MIHPYKYHLKQLLPSPTISARRTHTISARTHTHTGVVIMDGNLLLVHTSVETVEARAAIITPQPTRGLNRSLCVCVCVCV